jgi:hypothetical protein
MPRPQIAAVVGVCDEIEIIDRSIMHLESQGVETIVAVDMQSTDGTRERLREMRDAGRIALIEREGDPNRDADYLTCGVQYARRITTPDWILIQDADEFWIHASGDLRVALEGRDESVLLVSRYNACLCNNLQNAFSNVYQPGVIASLDVWAQPLRLTRELMDENPSIAWIRAQPVSKVVARADKIGGVAAGGHGITERDGTVLPGHLCSDLVIVHVPFLSMRRFQRKIERAACTIGADRSYFHGATGWHWKRWIEIFHNGMLEKEYEKQAVSASVLSSGKQSGAICLASALIEPVDRNV